MLLVFESASDETVEQDIFSFLSSVFELDVETIKTLELSDVGELFKALFVCNDMESFFTRALRLPKPLS